MDSRAAGAAADKAGGGEAVDRGGAAELKRVVWVLSALNLLFLCAMSYFIVTRGLAFGQPQTPWTAVEVLTVVLAALSALLTALGIIVAIAAIWGYNSLRSLAVERAEAVAREVAQQTAEVTAQATAEPVAARVAEEVVRSMAGAPAGDDYGAAAGGGR